MENHIWFLWSPCPKCKNETRGFIPERETKCYQLKWFGELGQLIQFQSSHFIPGTLFWTAVEFSLSQCFDFDTTWMNDYQSKWFKVMVGMKCLCLKPGVYEVYSHRSWTKARHLKLKEIKNAKFILYYSLGEKSNQKGISIQLL